MANDLLKYGAIGVLLFGGYRYWRAYKVGSNLDIEISGVMANAISKNNFSIGVNLDVTNKSTERITLSNSNLKCYINGRYVGVAKVPYTQIINASTTTKVFVVVDVFYKEVFAEWWNMFVQLATTVKLTIAGSLKFNGVYVPIPAIDIKQFKMSELFESPKVSGWLEQGALNPYKVYWIYIFPIDGLIKLNDFRKIMKVLIPYHSWGKSTLGNHKYLIRTHVGLKESLDKKLNMLSNLDLEKEYRVYYTTDKQFGLYATEFEETGENNGIFTKKQIENSIVIG